MMRVSVERLRRWLLAGAGLLVVVIAGFLVYAHYRAHRFLTELPRKLGANIRQEANSFTWSQTVKGRTVFTVHAAKAIQHNDGKYTMRDVGITVYGNGQDQGNRVDHISGKEFELDQAAGIVRAVGEVHLDLQAPAKETPDVAAGKDQKAVDHTHEDTIKKDPQLIHVKTSGLVYLQKLGIAATDQQIEFEYNGLTGHAIGADYNADSGVLVLHAAVNVSGLENGQPVLLTASRAELDRASRKVLLKQAKYVTVNGDGEGRPARQTVEAQQAVVTMRPDGSAEHMTGGGGVIVTDGDGSQMTAQRGEVSLNEDNKPQSLHLTGAVHYAASDDSRQASGEAAEARVAFDNQGHAQKAVLTGSVHLNELVPPSNAASANGSAVGGAKTVAERDLTAETVEMALAVDANGRSWLKDAKASGNARLKVIDSGKDKKGQRASFMKGDVLRAHMEMQGGRPALKIVQGDGSTSLEQRGEDGVVQTSSGDSLRATFRSTTSVAGRQVSSDTRDEIETAVQQGHVIATRTLPAKPGQAGGPETDRATAEKATYDGGSQRMTLTGAVEMQSAEGSLWADRVAMEQKTGDAAAQGSVKASFVQSGQGEMVHVLADHADIKKANDRAIFYGATGKSARLWQNGSQIEAPVLEFEQKQRRLTAHGDGSGVLSPVHTVLVSVGSSSGDRSSKGDPSRKPAVVRIGSREMVYSDQAKTAQFSGAVKVESADGVMRGQQATAYLQTASKKKSASPSPASMAGDDGFMAGAVERVVVTGAIEILQTGRRATGDRLVYTAGDGIFVLTGTEVQPPKVIDAERGTVTGRELRFRQQDASVVISNGDANGAGQRVRTETRVKKER